MFGIQHSHKSRISHHYMCEYKGESFHVPAV